MASFAPGVHLDTSHLTKGASARIKWSKAWSSVPAESLTASSELQQLTIEDCNSQDALATIFGQLRQLRRLKLVDSTTNSLPDAISNLILLTRLEVNGSGSLRLLPSALGLLSHLQVLALVSCNSLQSLPSSISSLCQLTSLEVSKCPNLAVPDVVLQLSQLQLLQIRSVHSCTDTLLQGLDHLPQLTSLAVQASSSVAALPLSTSSLSALQDLELSWFTDAEPLPVGLYGCLRQLQCLRFLSCTNMTTLPSAVSQLSQLQVLEFDNCQGFEILPTEIGGMTQLRKLRLLRCARPVSFPVSISTLHCRSPQPHENPQQGQHLGPEGAQAGLPSVSKYTITGAINSAMFGNSLQAAQDSSTGRDVSILQLPRAGLVFDASWLQRVQVAVQLRHPYLMQVHALLLSDSHLNVVLDSCTGDSLQQYVKKWGGRLSEERARWLFQQLVLAVDYAHSMGVAGLDLDRILLKAPPSHPDQMMVQVPCPLTSLSNQTAATSSSSNSMLSGHVAADFAPQLADIACCGAVLLKMLGGKLQPAADSRYVETSSGSVTTAEAVADADIRASAAPAYLLPADHGLTAGCQQLLDRLLNPHPLRVLGCWTTSTILQDSWFRKGLPEPALGLNARCRGLKPLWQSAEQELRFIAAAIKSLLSFDLHEQLSELPEGLSVQVQPLGLTAHGCSQPVCVYEAVMKQSQQQQEQQVWLCTLPLPAATHASRKSQQQLEQIQQQQQQGPVDVGSHSNLQQAAELCGQGAKLPSREFVEAVHKLQAQQPPPSSNFVTTPVMGLCLRPPVLVLPQPQHGTLASWLLQQQQRQSATPLLRGDSLMRLLLDVASGLQAMHSLSPPLVHGCVNAGAVHLLRDPSAKPHYPQPQWKQWQLAQLSLLEPWLQEVTHIRGAHPWLSAPEVLQDAAPFSTVTDVYGFGMLMLQLAAAWVPAGSSNSNWDRDVPAPGAALATAVKAAAGSKSSLQQQQLLKAVCEQVRQHCALVWPPSGPAADSGAASSSKGATAETSADMAGLLPAGYLGLMWACLSADPSARPSIDQVQVQLQRMAGEYGTQAAPAAAGTLVMWPTLEKPDPFADVWPALEEPNPFEDVGHGTEAADSAAAFAVLHTVGDGTPSGAILEVGECVGEGSFGRVFRARGNAQDVAVKVYKLDASVLRVQAEVRAAAGTMAACAHPCIVKVFGYCHTPPAVVMELCDCSMWELLDKACWQARNPEAAAAGCRPGLSVYSWQARLQVLLQVALALAHMHSLPTGAVLHNNLRAQTVLIARQPDGSLDAKVGNFASACRVGADGFSAEVLQHGNPLWTAPEVLTSQRDSSSGQTIVSKASDVWSFGTFIYEVLTGAMPHMPTKDHHHDLRAFQLVFMACQGQPMPLELPPDENILLPLPTDDGLRQQLRSLFEDCCKIDPSDRPNMADVVQVLQQCVQHGR